MKDFIQDLKEILFYILFMIVVFLIIYIGVLLILQINKSSKIKAEWNTKVNNCILNENSRNDCKLIIYRDKQIHERRIKSSSDSSAMSGAMVGGMLGSSMR